MSYIIKFQILSLLLVAIPGHILANFDCQTNLKPKGQELLELQRTYDGLKTFSADFQQKSYLSTLGVEEVSSGKLWVESPGKTKWSYSIPEKIEYLIKDKSFWHYQATISQLQVTDLDKSNLSALPTDLLTGQVNFSNSFNLSLLCLSSQDRKVLTLLPKTEDFAVENVKLLLENQRIAAIEFIDYSGNVNSLELSAVDWNPQIGDEVFSIDYPKETFLNDTRNQ